MKRIAGSLVLAGVIAQGCDNPPPLGPDGRASIQTDAAGYVLVPDGVGWTTEIPFRYENRSAGPWYLPNCNGAYQFSLEKWVDGRWRIAYAPVLQACLSPVIRIEQNETFSDRIRVWAGFPGNNWHPKFEYPDPEGVYRMVLQTLSSFDANTYPFGTLIPMDQRVSTAFELRVGDAPREP